MERLENFCNNRCNVCKAVGYRSRNHKDAQSRSRCNGATGQFCNVKRIDDYSHNINRESFRTNGVRADKDEFDGERQESGWEN